MYFFELNLPDKEGGKETTPSVLSIYRKYGMILINYTVISRNGIAVEQLE